MRAVLLVAIWLCSLSLFAQVGLNVNYLDAQPEEWRSGEEDPRVNLPGQGWQLGLDYWFRLKSTRIEFLPTLAYQYRKTEFGLSPAEVTSVVQSVGLFLNTNFYLLDLKGDCDCPTFSKQGPAIQKGLYLQISPGMSYFGFELDDEANSLKDNEFSLNVGLALGLDIGITDGLTLSPQAGVRYYPGLEWASLGPAATATFQFPEKLQSQADVLDYQFGLRLGLNL